MLYASLLISQLQALDLNEFDLFYQIFNREFTCNFSRFLVFFWFQFVDASYPNVYYARPVFLCTTWVVFFSSCCLETDGKGEVYTKRSQVREGRVHQILPGKHSGVKVFLRVTCEFLCIFKRFPKNLATSSNWLYVY